jgi:dolichol kinase
MLAFVVLLAILFVIVVGVEIIARKSKLPLEVTRKITHILVGVAVALSTGTVARGSLIALAIMFTLVIMISRRRGIFRSIHDPNRAGLGELWYPIGILLAVVLFANPAVETYAIYIVAVSDGLAGLVGKSFGKMKVPYITASKTYAGTATFMVTAFVLSSSLLPLPYAVGAAVYLGLIELLSFKGIDNLLLPLAAGVIAVVFGV